MEKPIMQMLSYTLGIRPFVMKPAIEIDVYVWTSSIIRFDGKYIHTKNTRYEPKHRPRLYVTKIKRDWSWHGYTILNPRGKFMSSATPQVNGEWYAFGRYFKSLWRCRVFADIKYLKSLTRSMR